MWLVFDFVAVTAVLFRQELVMSIASSGAVAGLSANDEEDEE